MDTDKQFTKSVIDGLKSTSSSRVYESLITIKSKISVNNNGIKLFRSCGGLEYLLPHLRKPNERILDITLSILGNCCLEEESSLAVGKLNSYGSLVTILKTVNRDSIVGRACRVIGNLAQKPVNAEGLHSHGAVTALITLIENRDKKTSYPTLTMAVRAVRQLWMVTEKREEMLTLNSVRCVAILLTTECESAGIIKMSPSLNNESEGVRPSQEELILSILKCLGYFTTHATVKCAEQIQGDGRGYQCLVALTKSYESLALKCLMNLCFISSCRPLLGIAGFVECIVGILQKISEVAWWPDGATRALSQLSGESVNRSRLRHCGGLPLLVSAARVSSHAMHALLQYIFDETSFQILIGEGLINLLTDELSNHLITMEFEHSNVDKLPEPICDNQVINGGTKNKSVTQKTEQTTKTEVKDNLPIRRKSFLTHNEDCKVVIERDNMLVGFVDNVEIDDTNDSESEDEDTPCRRKCLKRARSSSPKSLQKNSLSKLKCFGNWSASCYWEPKTSDFSSSSRHSVSSGPLSPDRGPLSPYSDQSGFSPEYRVGLNKKTRWDWSPESGVSTGEGSSASPFWTEYQWSPSSSGGPASPFSGNEENSDSDISGRYSPVCSEPEGDEGEAAREGRAAAELDAAQVAHDLDELIMEDDDDVGDPVEEEDNSKIDTNSKSSRIACVLMLLFRVSNGVCGSHCALREEVIAPNQSLDLLTGRECLNALLDYVERCRRPLGRVARILATVLSNALCLMGILKHRIALRLHHMSVSSKHPPTKCHQCKQIIKLSGKLLTQLTILAESSYGIGEISYHLLKGSSSIKQTLSLTLPYIVRTQKPLKKYFIDCSALNLLFTIIAESKEDIQDCVTALVKLATSVNIKDPKTLEKRFKDQLCVGYDPILDNLSVDDIVTFELDDRSTVKANKVFLCQNSEVFSAMLMGCFKESGEKRVRIKNVTKPALEYLFTLLQCGLNDPKSEVETFPLADELDTNLEVLLLADRFLFEKLKDLLSSAILQFQLTPKTADKIYVWSLSEGMGFLCVESVAYLLTGKMCESERTNAFTVILNLQYKEQWLDDMKSMILRQLEK